MSLNSVTNSMTVAVLVEHSCGNFHRREKTRRTLRISASVSATPDEVFLRCAELMKVRSGKMN